MTQLALPPGELSVLCLGAHPDDIEIGCGGTLLALGERRQLTTTSVILTGRPERQDEAREAAQRFLADAAATVETYSLQDGHLPAHWDEVKDLLEGVAARLQPDLILAPRRDDAHQDHRLIAELVTTVWRTPLVLHYEIPKWDGDLGSATHYVPLTDEQARRKVELLNKSFPSQHGRDWWDDEMFLGLMRLRGMECRATYAEGFVVAKAVLDVGGPAVGRGVG